jgi:CHAT domain-containing protein
MAGLEKELSAQSSRPQAELSPAALSDLGRRLAEKRREYEEVLTRLKVSDPRYASLRSVETLGPEEVSKLLDAQTTLLSFFVTPGETVAFVLTKDSLQFVELRVTEQELAAAVKALRGFASREDAEAALSELHALLMPRLKRYLKTRAVCVIPHGVLHYVPFAALRDGQGYLGDEYTFFTLPSASTIALINRRGARPSKGLLALAQGRAEGLPLLRFAEREAKAAAGLYDARPFVGAAATETVFRSEAGKNDTLLLAAHGRLDGAHPLFSQIVLAADGQHDGMLQLHEIYELDLRGVGLVVLSACETQQGARSKGDDIIALNRAFLSAGASSVVASLWRVDDEATEVLTREFFTRLKSGDSKAAALRAAQRKTREQFPNPYYWAAFVLTGDPRAPG